MDRFNFRSLRGAPKKEFFKVAKIEEEDTANGRVKVSWAPQGDRTYAPEWIPTTWLKGSLEYCVCLTLDANVMLEEFRDRQAFLVGNQATRLGADPHAAGLKAVLAGVLNIVSAYSHMICSGDLVQPFFFHHNGA